MLTKSLLRAAALVFVGASVIASARGAGAANVPTPTFDDCALVPWNPVTNAPRTPSHARSSCSASGYFKVDCGTTPNGCAVSHIPTHVESRRTEVVNGACVVLEQAYPVDCGEVIGMRAIPPACASLPSPPREARTFDVQGRQVFSGEGLKLAVIAEDACQNTYTCERDPFTTPDPGDPSRMLLCAPDAPFCPGGACILNLVTPVEELTVDGGV